MRLNPELIIRAMQLAKRPNRAYELFQQFNSPMPGVIGQQRDAAVGSGKSGKKPSQK